MVAPKVVLMNALESSSRIEELQVDALKRKLIEQDSELRTAKSKIDDLEAAVEVVKREHQLKTSKVSQLLETRHSLGGKTDNEELNTMKLQISLLQHQLRKAEDREGALKLQLFTTMHQ